MVKSMTGFGKSNIQVNDKEISIEVKSLNSKHLDCFVRIPSFLRSKEIELRKMVGKVLNRGKIDFQMTLNHLENSQVNILNKPKLRSYMEELAEIAHASDIELLKLAIKFPDAIESTEASFTTEEWGVVENAILDVLQQVDRFRIDEGSTLHKDLSIRIQNIRNLSVKMSDFAPERMDQVKNKLKKKLEDLQIEVDANRFEQELIYFLEKIDINEEEVRLFNHLNYFELVLEKDEEASGKKLNFIAQEIGREINTMGSKSNHAAMQQLVVQMKEELEKIKEQTLNIL